MTELEPYWLDEADWIVLVEFLSPDDAEDRARGAEAIGYLFGYAQMTDTRMLALVGDPMLARMNCCSLSHLRQ